MTNPVGKSLYERLGRVGLALALLVTALVTPAHAANCTAEQGQLFIDEGRYKQAIGGIHVRHRGRTD